MDKIKIKIAETVTAGGCYYRAITDKGDWLVARAKTQETCVKLAISRAKKGLVNGDVIEVYYTPPYYFKRPQTLLKSVTIGGQKC